MNLNQNIWAYRQNIYGINNLLLIAFVTFFAKSE